MAGLEPATDYYVIPLRFNHHYQGESNPLSPPMSADAYPTTLLVF